MKICRKCQDELTPTNMMKSQYDNGDFICKTCYGEYQKQYRKKNTSKVKMWAQKQNWKLRSRFARLKSSFHKRGYEVSLTFDEFCILSNEPCAYCQNKLCLPSLQGSNLDRIDNSKGYSIGNVQPCCKVCNSIRNQFLTVAETHVAVDAILKYRG